MSEGNVYISRTDLVGLVKAFDESKLRLFHVKHDDFEIVLSKSDVIESRIPATHDQSVKENSPKAGTFPTQRADTHADGSDDAAEVFSEDEGDTGLVDRDRFWVIKANSLGTFYSRPAPDQADFVEVGDVIEEDATVGLIEAMKVYTAVAAGVRGRVAKRLVENGEFVEYGQPLFEVEIEA